MIRKIIEPIFAIGSNFLAASGTQWLGSLKYVNFYVFFAAWWLLAWFVDSVFQGTGHPGYNTLVWYIEQGTRLLLLIILLPQFQLFGLIFAYTPGIILKGSIALYLIRKKICAFKPYWMATIIAPAIIAILVFFIIKGITLVLPMKNVVVVVLLFAICILFGLNLHGFFTGLLGGWDDLTLNEFKEGIYISRLTRGFFSPLVKAVQLDHNAYPWKNKFGIDIFEKALKESEQLTNEKVRLEM